MSGAEDGAVLYGGARLYDAPAGDATRRTCTPAQLASALMAKGVCLGPHDAARVAAMPANRLASRMSASLWSAFMCSTMSLSCSQPADRIALQSTPKPLPSPLLRSGPRNKRPTLPFGRKKKSSKSTQYLLSG